MHLEEEKEEEKEKSRNFSLNNLEYSKRLPIFATSIYIKMKKEQLVVEMEDCQFPGQDFGLPRTVEEVKAELMDAERELDNPSAWTPLSEFISDFKQSHQSWLQ